MSVKPAWTELIISGRKTVELRRRFPKFSNRAITALLYSTGPAMAMVGAVRIKETMVLPPALLWPRVADRACVTEGEYKAYFEGAKDACALFLGAVDILASPFSLAQLRLAADFAPPMSWRWAKPRELELVKELT
ncbi:hypothetical protein [Azospirillum argentinense]|uniref:hypothetical protein n=1 Tax=Azospirillum argentinense TaxID=2970906 RepID=UPI0010C07B75|nr:hypothetical protein [Azospirillum argentinense]